MVIRKLKHYFGQGTIYFVTSNTKDRKSILVNDIARFLLTTIAYHKYVLNFSLFGYVIMPDHFHILVQPSEKYPLSKVIGLIKGNFARKYNEFFNTQITGDNGNRCLSIGYQRDPRGHLYLPVWQKEYYESGVRNEKEFLDKLNYMHNNPVKEKLVEFAKDYEFSSYRQYFGEPRQKIQIMIDKIWL